MNYANSKDIKSSKSNWSKRSVRAIEQENLFKLLNEHNNYNHKKIVKKLISEFLEKELSIEKSIVPTFLVEVDMTKIRKSYSDLDNYIHDKIKKLNNSLVIFGDDPKGVVRNYIFVIQREDGMVVVIGQSSFKWFDNKVIKSGDLFNNMDLNSLKGTPKLILMSILGSNFYEIEEVINQYYQNSWVFPIPDKYSTKVNEIEEKLGDMLINSNVPIFNYYSHRY